MTRTSAAICVLAVLLISTMTSGCLGLAVQREIMEVHNLRGSHLVWVGWGLVMLGGALALASSNRSSQEGE